MHLAASQTVLLYTRVFLSQPPSFNQTRTTDRICSKLLQHEFLESWKFRCWYACGMCACVCIRLHVRLHYYRCVTYRFHGWSDMGGQFLFHKNTCHLVWESRSNTNRMWSDGWKETETKRNWIFLVRENGETFNRLILCTSKWDHQTIRNDG